MRVAGLLVIAACCVACWSGGGSSKPAEPAPIANKQPEAPPPLREQEETAMMALERFTNEMCLCTTSECATQVSNDLTTWAQAYTRDHPDSRELSEEDQRRANELATRMGECMMKAMTSSSSTAGSNAPMPP